METLILPFVPWKLTASCCGLISDIFTISGPPSREHCDRLMARLFLDLADPDKDRAAKPHVLLCLGDIAMALTADYVAYDSFFV